MTESDLGTETEKLLAELEMIGQDFSDPPPPPPAPSDELLDSFDLPPAPDQSDMFESVVTFSKGSPNKLEDLPPPPPSDVLSNPPPKPPHKGVTVNVKSSKVSPPRVASKTEKARAIGRASAQGGMATSGQDTEGFISVSALKRQFERGPNKLTGTTITPVATLLGPPIPERSAYPSQPIKSPNKPPPPAVIPPPKPIPPPVSETASSLDDLLSDLNQVATGSDLQGPLPADAGTSHRCKAEGPGLTGTLRTREKTWFQISGTDLIPSDVTVNVIGPSGPNSTDISQSGDRIRVEFTPKVAGEYTIEIKVAGQHIPKSPYYNQVDFAEFTDKCTADGMGLISGNTGETCNFVIRCGPEAVVARLRVHILGPSKAEPIEMIEEDKIIYVSYHPTSPGQYKVKIIWAEAHIAGSPFLVNIGGETKNDVSKLKLEGDGLKGGNTNEPLRIQVIPISGAGAGPLSIKIAGPTKPRIVAEEAEDSSITVTYTCRDAGHYDIHLRWGDCDIPGFPMGVEVLGESRVSDGTLCTTTGDGIVQGEVNVPAEFEVHIDEDAGPGPLSVSVLGPYPAGPIVITPSDGVMKVKYLPVAPGDYTIQATWGGQHISGSPFIAHVIGIAIRDTKKVTAVGFEKEVKVNQLTSYKILAGEGAGPGPLRARLSGRTKAEMSLMKNEDGTMSVSFVATEKGNYILELLWGDEDEPGHIYGSPFSIDVV
ncbi:Filamin-C-like [Oopsacas minuta]|uniref:Filamin-C-like n=1 Tax=Oopsacas minuta TaxID=111878 RepID=A0AAV7JDD9_9METZ|nr:Filamin-C-like [Oopsacas minuta]